MTAQREDPGKTLGIVGFVLAFFVSLAGLIVSAIGYTRSKRAGFKNGLALAGIIISSINFVFGTIGIISAITIVAYNGVSMRANSNSSLANATSVQKVAEAYNAEKGVYPQNAAQLNDQTTSRVPSNITFADTALTSKPSSTSVIAFYSCGTGGNKIEYWNYTSEIALRIYTGDASDFSTCEIIPESVKP
ncbi:MAG: hypothetical protein JWM52_92 [Candidatus Saccharibacteria bacterium]|nr:hypothetical protein [Candidatus Saccharibacteria bacterium]